MGPLQALVDATIAGATLSLPTGTYLDSVTTTKDLSLEGIDAGSVIIDGSSVGVPLTIDTNTTVSLRRLSFRDGHGGAIKNYGVLTLSECSVIGNRPGYGQSGSILNYGTLIMDRCLVSKNVAAGGGGGDNYGTLWMNGCTISDNVATTQGGGILNRQPGRLTIRRSTVSGNLVSDGHGGGSCQGLSEDQSSFNRRFYRAVAP